MLATIHYHPFFHYSARTASYHFCLPPNLSKIMKSFIIATLIASAAAFAPSQKATSITAVSANKFAGEVGAQAPLGFFDPMGFLSSEDDSKFANLREAELKHGRIAQLAVVGKLRDIKILILIQCDDCKY